MDEVNKNDNERDKHKMRLWLRMAYKKHFKNRKLPRLQASDKKHKPRRLEKMIPKDRVLRCSITPDSMIAIFHKPDAETKLRAFKVEKHILLAIIIQCHDKKDLTDPYFNDEMDLAKCLGLFTIEATHPTLKRLLKALTPYEIQ